MGLDIFAYSKLFEVTEKISPEEIEDRGLIELKVDEDNRITPTEAGVFCCEEENSFVFRAGSYFGYNAVREIFSDVGMGVLPQEVWDNPKKYEGKPFYEIVDFSDCSGAIGTSACQKLLADFRAYQTQLEEALDPLLEKKAADYIANWIHALELAADNGVLLFM